MDALPLSLTLGLVALVCWWAAPQLAAFGNGLLARVAPAAAAPTALTTSTVASVLPLHLAGKWSGVLRWGTPVAAMLVVWHALARGHQHAPGLIAAAALTICVAVLALVAVMDGATHLIFGTMLWIPVILATIGAVLVGPSAVGALLMGGVATGGITLGLYALGQMLYGTDVLGFGDVQLAAAIGVVLGWPVALSAVLWACVGLGIFALVLLATRRIASGSYLPLGAFLALGAILALILKVPPWL